jgi:hypothetical protein
MRAACWSLTALTASSTGRAATRGVYKDGAAQGEDKMRRRATMRFGATVAVGAVVLVLVAWSTTPARGDAVVGTERRAAVSITPTPRYQFIPPNSVAGTGTPSSCTEGVLNTALGCDSRGDCSGGGNVTFNCGANPVTITVTSPKTMAGETSIDGGGLVTLSGGGLTQLFDVHPGATLTLTNLTIVDGSGGAIGNDGTLTLTNSKFSGNDGAPFGGAIYNYNDGTLTVTSSTFTRNAGSAINNEGTLTVSNSTFTRNSSGPAGGGAIDNTGTITVTTSAFSGNSTPFGGSGGAIDNEVGTLIVTNSTFPGNSASDGGAIYNHMSGTLIVTSSTFSGNSPDATSNYFGFATLTNTIVAQSAFANCTTGTITDGGHNLDSDGSCGVGPATDPMLDPAGLANNGGPTQTIALLLGSPAIDAGDQTVCTAAPVKNVDQRGYLRPGMGATRCSIGAFEFNSAGPPPPSCVGDCTGSRQVTVADILALVNIVLGNDGACPNGVAAGVVPDVSVILQAVTNALNGCPPA